jgi:hypothetical protein
MLSKVLPGQTKVELEKLKVAFCIAGELKMALVPFTRPLPTVARVEFWFLVPVLLGGGGGEAARGTALAVPVAVTPAEELSISARDLLVGSYSTKGR